MPDISAHVPANNAERRIHKEHRAHTARGKRHAGLVGIRARDKRTACRKRQANTVGRVVEDRHRVARSKRVIRHRDRATARVDERTVVGRLKRIRSRLGRRCRDVTNCAQTVENVRNGGAGTVQRRDRCRGRNKNIDRRIVGYAQASRIDADLNDRAAAVHREHALVRSVDRDFGTARKIG